MWYEIPYAFPPHALFTAERLSMNNFVHANCCSCLYIINKFNKQQL